MQLPPFLAAMLLLAVAPPALADVSSAPDVVVYADPTMAAIMDHFGAAFRQSTGVPVRVFPMPTSLAIALVHQGARNDVLAIEASHAGGIAGVVSVHDPVVLAAAEGVSATLADAVSAPGRLATVDPLSADRLDGPALAARLSVAAGRVTGQPNGPDAAKQLLMGAASFALIERADARLPGVHEVAVVPDAPARHYLVGASHSAMSPNVGRFLDFIHGSGSAKQWSSAGWEVDR